MDMEAKQEATTGRCFERHLSLVPGRGCGLQPAILCASCPPSLISPHPHTHTHPSRWDDLGPGDPQDASRSWVNEAQHLRHVCTTLPDLSFGNPFLTLCLSL